MFYLLEKLINVSHNNDSHFFKVVRVDGSGMKKDSQSKAVPCVNPGTGMQ